MLFLLLCPLGCLRPFSCSSKWLCHEANPTRTEPRHSFTNRLISGLAWFLAALKVVVAAKYLNLGHFAARPSRLRCWTIEQGSILCEFKSLVITSRMSREDRSCGYMLTWREDGRLIEIRYCASQGDHVTEHVTILPLLRQLSAFLTRAVLQLQLLLFFPLIPYFHALR